MRSLALSVFVFFGFLVSAQMPDTDVWLFKVAKEKAKPLTLTDPLNITARTGYDNQPSFSADSKKIFYVSTREDNQADIYVYTISKKSSLKLTNTIESEYSPFLTPPNNLLGSVVVEKDSSQKIHFINPLTGVHEKQFVFDSVGYYTFLNPDTVIYYKLTNPHSLRYYVNSTKEDKFIAASPIRGFKAVNRHAFVFGLKDSIKVVFYKYDFLLRKAEKFCEYPSTNEDIIWHSEHGLLKSEENKILKFDPLKNAWETLFDLTSFGIKKITRFIFDPSNKYFLVVDNK